MAKLDQIKKAQRKPFGDPAAGDNGRFTVLIPEGAETGVIPDGQYPGKSTNLIRNVSQGGKGNPQWVFTFSIIKGKYRGMDFDLHCPLILNSLWKLTDTCTALGLKKNSKGEFDFDRTDALNVLVMLEVKLQKGTGGYRDQSKVMRVLPWPDGAGTKAKGSTFVVPEETDEEDESDEERPEEQDEVTEEDEIEYEDTDEEATDEAEGEDDEGNEEGDEEEGEEGDEEPGKGWNTAKERAQFDRVAKRPGRPRLARDTEVDVTPKRRVGPKMMEQPVKRGPGRPKK